MQFANDSWRIQQSIFTLGYFEYIKMCKNIPLHYAQLCICNLFDFMNVDLEKSYPTYKCSTRPTEYYFGAF